MVKYTCKDCNKRQLGCHDTCEEYLKIKQRNLEIHKNKIAFETYSTAGKFESIHRMKTKRKSTNGRI